MLDFIGLSGVLGVQQKASGGDPFDGNGVTCNLEWNDLVWQATREPGGDPGGPPEAPVEVLGFEFRIDP